ncbi:uncharacterized protein N7458_009689 [Penicillium daleae]|uniref:Uncharacterized protein n=1 Tax=Penicillium daleae TaxID=63821 RepID=A0AAD6BXH1_9EURO|nr:uncharacterized protein N7458_009689 [Penicillium daleae]KAJ5438691.1 hypothetical protein N7458_009689 [Penicillium daleae]
MTGEHLQKTAQRGRDWAGHPNPIDHHRRLRTAYCLRLRLRTTTTLTGSPLSGRATLALSPAKAQNLDDDQACCKPEDWEAPKGRGVMGQK